MTPDDPAARSLMMAQALREAGWAAKAEDACRAVLRDHPRHPEALHQLALLHEARGARAEAVALLRLAIDADPEAARAHLALARLLALAQDMGGAVLSLRRALALAPGDTDALVRFGSLCEWETRTADAAALYGRAHLLAPGDPVVLRHLAGLHRAKGDPRSAEACLRAALDADPDDAETLAALGEVLRAQDRVAEAADAFAAAVALRDDLLDAHLGLGMARHALGRPDEAVAGLCAATAGLSGNATALLRIAGLLFDQGHEERAAAIYRDFADLVDNRGRYPGQAPRGVRLRPAAQVCGERGWPYHVVAPPASLRVAGGDGTRFGYDLPEVFLAFAEDPVVVPHLYAPLVGDALLVDGFNTNSRVSLTMLPHLVRHSPDDRMLIDLTEPSVTVEEEAVLLGGGPNWSHGVLDWASKLAVLERFPALSKLPVLVDARIPRSILDLMELLGLERGRMVPVPGDAVLKAKRLWLPSLTHPYQHMASMHVDFLRRRLAGAMAEGLAAPRRRIFLSRRQAGYRLLLNEAEVLVALAPLGVEPVVPDGLSMAEQITLFASAELIVGPIGGGSAAVAFASPGAAYVELAHARIALAQYNLLTGLLGQRYRRVVGDTAGNRTTNVFDHDFTVPPDAVVAAARALLDGV
ncbi:glycosyltransferase 61 family protein [Azospirillum sp.]|uniref:glycosyltransferase 61 family protein n=1 Tax=Azospirillum sp. TaxID=34012 RepID=UPI003D70C525